MGTVERTAVLNVPVEFGGVSFGDHVARIGVRVIRQRLNIDAADGALCGRRLNGKIMVCPPDEDGTQTHFDGDPEHEVDGVFDVAGFRVSPKHISCGLAFNLSDIDDSELSKFAKKTGRLVVYSVEQLATKAKDAKPADIPGQKRLTLAAGETWQEFPLSKLGLPETTIAKLVDASISNIGALKEYLDHHQLTDIDGIGAGKADKIKSALEQFWAANPQ